MSVVTVTYYWGDDLLDGRDALAERTDRAFAEIEAVLPRVHSIAWDGCHKIYLLMNAEQTYYMGDYRMLVRAEHVSTERLMATLREWYDDSCALRFIQGCDGPFDDTEWATFIPQIWEA